MPSFTVFKAQKDGSIKEAITTKPDLTYDQVLVRITASGLCFTDVHYRHADMALGHEGVGIVQEVGPVVKNLRKGDRVGWGYLHNSCGMCEKCWTGHETYCAKRETYGAANFDQGSMASHGVWRESFLFRVPEGLTDAEAAPLMCGGATVWSAMELYGIGPTSRVGVIGVGGLGHLAIQFISKMGAEAVVFSGTDSKEAEAKRLGANKFYATKGKSEIDDPALQSHLDYLIVTSSYLPDWNVYLPLLAPEGKIIPLTVSDGDFKVPYEPLLMRGLAVQGSLVSPRFAHQHMLDFAARNGIKPLLNTFPLSVEGIEEAFNVLTSGKMRYRGVLIPEQH
ncbi:GroES-like protein [Rhizodiscina lignyota]|uniref:GroES-like protein n=1 Tax=Rhizodiscina lignyota TaxID=1504668 RepID=A0A9P4M519_9PEZI|nr:GroES-like protein [Rhizodiscina lignyota]